mmetsp:Transcript_58352/g.190312  ORF Transcript_58352/g.190312 Transcript_58352/m.190312 type:complete len:317 (+) Transcript_58352:110-1060(+)
MGQSLLLRSAGVATVTAAILQAPWFGSLPSRSKALLCLLLAYLPSYLDRSEFKTAPRRSQALARPVRACFRAFVQRVFTVEKTVLEAADKLASCKQCILAIHPHGVLSLDHLLTVIAFDSDLDRAAPQCRRSALSAGVLFKLPVLREVLLWTGCVDAGGKTVDACLKAGLSLSVVPGGEREQLLAQRGPLECIVLKKRKGFVKYALRHGVALVPVYCFGEAQLYHQSQFLMQFRSWVQRTIGIALVLPLGPGGLPGIPFPSPLRMVVGAPLDMPRIEQPTEAQISEHHARYMAELEGLFKRHNTAAGYGHVQLQMV